MTRTNFPVAVCVLVGLSFSVPVAGAAKSGKVSAAGESADVALALRTEIDGLVDRRATLGELLRSHPELAAARWQSGNVRDGKGWRAFDAAAGSQPVNERLESYRARRDAAQATREGQLQLADWCRERGLADQERAHLQAVLAFGTDANVTPILLRLGFRPIGGRWLSREELTEWRESNRQAEASLKRFGPRLERIAKQVAGGRRQHEAGLAALRQLTDRESIPAMELILASRNEPTALAVVKALTDYDGYEATVALAKQAVFSEWLAVRKAATTGLKSRPFEHFVPQLTALLSTPIEGALEVRGFGWRDLGADPSASWRMQSGVLEYAYIMKRETGDQIQVARLNTINSLLDDYLEGIVSDKRAGVPVAARGETGDDLYRTALARGANDAVRALRDDLRKQELDIERQNEFIRETNERVGDVLASVSDQPSSAEPRTWWNWWNQYNDVSGEKPVYRVADEYQYTGNLAPVTPAPPILSRAPECLVAGTLVWTETGPIAIEKIRVGDRVLAKNVETGELGYKPVLQTTVQTPKELRALGVGDETILSTGGHRFWVSGKGWVRARDVSTSSRVHTATGNAAIVSSQQDQPAETYNLVVADWHTYFVGRTGILSQDVQLPRPTNKVVPGLDRARAVADGK